MLNTPDTTGLIAIATTCKPCDAGECPTLWRDPTRPGWIGIQGYTEPGQPAEAIVWHPEALFRDLAAQVPPL